MARILRAWPCPEGAFRVAPATAGSIRATHSERPRLFASAPTARAPAEAHPSLSLRAVTRSAPRRHLRAFALRLGIARWRALATASSRVPSALRCAPRRPFYGHPLRAPFRFTSGPCRWHDLLRASHSVHLAQPVLGVRHPSGAVVFCVPCQVPPSALLRAVSLRFTTPSPGCCPPSVWPSGGSA